MVLKFLWCGWQISTAKYSTSFCLLVFDLSHCWHFLQQRHEVHFLWWWIQRAFGFGWKCSVFLFFSSNSFVFNDSIVKHVAKLSFFFLLFSFHFLRAIIVCVRLRIGLCLGGGEWTLACQEAQNMRWQLFSLLYLDQGCCHLFPRQNFEVIHCFK